jgi:hypothetical protein
LTLPKYIFVLALLLSGQSSFKDIFLFLEKKSKILDKINILKLDVFAELTSVEDDYILVTLFAALETFLIRYKIG